MTKTMTDEEWAARTARMASARKRAYGRMPKLCPHCSSEDLYPTFDADIWSCSDCGQCFDGGAT
jgi:ribosomal protein L37AE/L43A